MYPELLIPLLTALGLALAALALVVVRQPVSRRLAFRQVARRRTEAALVIGGSVLGTAIVIGALVVGDTLNFSVRQEAYRTLGRWTSASSRPGPDRARRHPAAGRPRGRSRRRRGAERPHRPGVGRQRCRRAEGGRTAGPGLAAGLRRGVALRLRGRDSGLGGPDPKPGRVVVNEPLARSLSVSAGDPVTLYLFGAPRTYRVERVVPEEGLAGVGLAAG
ncbi:hypothetical protein L1856_07465 [Streptomyces sp. Tue 6430]|nr:hypothetical protein [Streptomyces sp. Tue 6430]